MSSVTKEPSVKAQVEAALLIHKPIDVYRMYGEALGLSQSAIYRHAAKLAESPKHAVAPRWQGDTSTGELVADKARLFHSHIEQRDLAIDRGDHATATREGVAAGRLMADLSKDGVTSDQISLRVEFSDANFRALTDVFSRRPDIVEELADTAKRLHMASLARTYQELAERAADLPTTTKE